MVPMKSVCVIGAGAAGLCALRHFTSHPEAFGPIICYEKTDRVGGTWNYSEEVGLDPNGLPIHTSMYRDMRTNLPMEIMIFPDFPWDKPPASPSYVYHTEVLKYLQDYTDHFNLLPYINFEHPITHLTRKDESWIVTVHDLTQDKSITQSFDIVILCPGRYCVPYYPQIPSQFEGSVIHSHDYRFPEPYTGQRAAVIGGGPSGTDICIEVGAVATEVTFVHSRDPYKGIPNNINQTRGQVIGFGPKSMRLKLNDDQIKEIEIDSLILATGYKFNLDYLDQESAGFRVSPDETLDGIYKHFIDIEQPSLAIISVMKAVLPFPLFHQQILYFMKVHLGDVKLPTREEMLQDAARDMDNQKSLGFRPKDRHLMNFDTLEKYIDDLTTAGQLEPLTPVTMKMYRALGPIRFQNVSGYKQKNYMLVGDRDFMEVE